MTFLLVLITSGVQAKKKRKKKRETTRMNSGTYYINEKSQEQSFLSFALELEHIT